MRGMRREIKISWNHLEKLEQLSCSTGAGSRGTWLKISSLTVCENVLVPEDGGRGL